MGATDQGKDDRRAPASGGEYHEGTENTFRTLFEAATDFILVLDAEGRVLRTNPITLRTLGYEEEEVIGQDIRFLHSSASDDVFERRLEWTDGARRPYEVQMKTKTGNLIFAEVCGAPLPGADGRVSSYVVFERDVTDRVKVRTDLEKTARDLERELAISTQLREEAQSASRAKTEFLANMSHELRTPLNAIIALSEILEEQSFGELNDSQVEYVGVILNSGRHLLHLINDLLDLAKVESGKMETQRTDVNIAELIESSLYMVKEKALKHGVKLSVEVDDELRGLIIQADEVKLKQIMFNLLSNAAKFTHDGGEIRVEAKWRDSVLAVKVEDTGIGLKPEDLERIFGAFEQVDSSYARRLQGTGLGLSLTRRLVELHGGKIWAESAGEGRGSAFSFVIPMALSELSLHEGAAVPMPDAAQEAAFSGGHDAQATQIDRKPLVLVVDDNQLTREMFTGYLSKVGYRTVQAQDGEQAVQTAFDLRPAAVLLDIMMPRKGGFDVLIELKNLPETKDIPVIVVSACEEREIGLALGAAAYLTKPADMDLVIGTLEATVGGHMSLGAQGADS